MTKNQSEVSAGKYAARALIGIGGSLFLIVLLVLLALPLNIYRWFVLKILARRFGPVDLRMGVNALGNGMALEFCNGGDLHSARFSAVCNFVLEGDVSYEELCHRIKEKWIMAKTETGDLKYSELQQYFAPWMGFMFFKQDLGFNLENHIKLHTLDEHASAKCSEEFYNELNEMLLNQKWKAGRSPWEVHLVQNYKRGYTLDAIGKGNENNCTLLSFRLHHALMDGFAMEYLFLEQLFGNAINMNSIGSPGTRNRKLPILEHMTHYCFLLLKMLQALGYSFALTVKETTPFHIPDSRKTWTQVVARGKVIPVQKIKMIKNHFGVNFASVLDSILGSSMGKMMRTKMGHKNMPKSIAYGASAPLPNHPKILRNHATGIMFEKPLDPEMDPVERLIACDRNFSIVKFPQFALFMGKLMEAIIGMPIYFSRMIGRNRFLGAGASHLPGPAHQLTWDNRKLVEFDAIAVPGVGVGGLVYLTVSYNQKIRIKAAAERAVMSREELQQTLRWMEEELDILYELALEGHEKD